MVRLGVMVKGRMFLLVVVLVSAALLLGLIASGLASAAVSPPNAVEWNSSTVSLSVHPYDTPRLDGDYVVYRGTSKDAVFLYQISTGQTTELTSSNTFVSDVHIDSGLVVWEASGDGIWLYDISSGGPALQVATVGLDPQVSGDRVVYRAPLSSNVWDLRVYDHGMGATTPLNINATGVKSPAIDGDYVAWVQGVGDARDIMMKNLSGGGVLNLSNVRGAGVADFDPQVSGGRVVWVGDDPNGDDTEIYLYSAGQSRRLTDNVYPDNNALIEGRRVAWQMGMDLFIADAAASNPAATAEIIVGQGTANSSVYQFGLGGNWVTYPVVGTNGVARYDFGTGSWVNLKGQYTGTSGYVQTDGNRILVLVDTVKLYLLEEGSATTTTTQPTTTTTLPPSTTTTTLPLSTTTTTQSPPSGQTFWDVPPSHSYYDAIEGMAAADVINGYTDGSFGPGRLVWRQHFAKMIVGTLGFPCSEANICPFSDVDIGGSNTLYPDNYIAVAADWGITNGIGQGQYGPYRNITRAQVITMVVRAAQSYTNGLDAPDNAYYSGWGLFRNFTDPTHGYNVQLAEYNGLITGVSGSGDVATWVWQPATRGEVAQILWNLSNMPGLAG